MGIRGLWKDIERSVKDIRGKDVPESPLRLSDEDKERLQKKLVELCASIAEKMWPAAQQYGLTRTQWDQIVKYGVDKLIDEEDE